MRLVAPWGLLSSIAAPLVLVGGFMLAASRQPSAYSWWGDTISALAAPTAVDSWIMTFALYALGLCHVMTAAALRAAAARGRYLLALGGAATAGVAVSPTAAAGPSIAHLVAASIAFGALALWPVLACRRHKDCPALLRRRASLSASAVLLLLLAWLVQEIYNESGRVGIAERVAAAAEALWPLMVVLSCRRRVVSAGAA